MSFQLIPLAIVHVSVATQKQAYVRLIANLPYGQIGLLGHSVPQVVEEEKGIETDFAKNLYILQAMLNGPRELLILMEV